MRPGPVPNPIITSAVLLCVLLFGPTLGAQEPCPTYASDGWDGGTPNGWVGTAGSTITVPVAGGNPGGYLRTENTNLIAAQTSDSPWIGDWRAAGLAWISFDFLYETADLLSPHIRLRESGSTNGWYFAVDQLGVNDGQWHHYELPIDPWWTDQEAVAAGWSDVGPPNISFSDTLASIGIVQLGASRASGPEALGIDNLIMTTCLFADGFESGAADQWDAMVGN